MGHLTAFRDGLPGLQSLEPEERRGLQSLSDGNRPFVDHAVSLAQSQPAILPGSFDLNEETVDIRIVDDLEPFENLLETLLQLVRDTRKIAGNDAFAGALEIYGYAKMAGRGEGFDALIDRTGRRFARGPRRKPDPVEK